MERKYEPSDFPYPLNEDIQAVYDAKKNSDKDQDNSRKIYLLKKAIYDMCLTMKSMCITGELRPDVRDDLSDYFWGFLL